MEDESRSRNHGGVNHGGGIVEEDHKAATIGNLWSIGNASGKHLGNIRGSICEAFWEVRQLRLRGHLGVIWNLIKRYSLHDGILIFLFSCCLHNVF